MSHGPHVRSQFTLKDIKRRELTFRVPINDSLNRNNLETNPVFTFLPEYAKTHLEICLHGIYFYLACSAGVKFFVLLLLTAIFDFMTDWGE